MKEDLNLLPSRAKFQALKIKLKKKVVYFMWVFGGLWLVGVGAVLVVWLVLKLGLEADKKKYKKLLMQYQSMEESAVASERLKYNSKLVSQVLEERFEYGESIRKMSSLFPPEIEISGFDLKQRNKFAISGETKKGEAIDELERLVKKINEGRMEGFDSIELKSLQVKDGVWVFSVEVTTK